MWSKTTKRSYYQWLHHDISWYCHAGIHEALTCYEYSKENMAYENEDWKHISCLPIKMHGNQWQLQKDKGMLSGAIMIFCPPFFICGTNLLKKALVHSSSYDY